MRPGRRGGDSKVESRPSPGVAALAALGIEKSFPGVRALRGVSLEVRAGEVHGLVGENGAGKSTLARVLAGIHPPDAGRVLLAGKNIRLASPRDAQDQGIAMVYQDTRLVPDLDIAQNVWLGREPGPPVLADRAEMERRTRLLLARLGLALPLDAPVRSLDFDERQMVEIARALTTAPTVLLLDEPTSALDGTEVERLFAVVRELRAAGTAVVFISHRLPEVFALCDRITVMRDGEVVGTVEAGAVDEEALVAMMVGRAVSVAYPPRAETVGAERLGVTDASSAGRFSDVSFSVAAGEIVGIGGIQGNGQAEIVRALFGLLPMQGAVSVDGVPAHLGSPRQAIAAGLIYVPGDRRRDGLFLPHSIRRNVSLPHLATWSKAGLLPAARERQAAADVIREFAVRARSAEQPVATLSGGNQQKVVLGRWTRGLPAVLIAEEPTQGVDVATKLDIYRRLRAVAAAGTAVLLVSSDLLELIGLSDRILVVSRGRIVDEVRGGEATEERIVGAAVRGPATPEDSAAPLAARPRCAPAGRRYASAALLAVVVLALAGLTASRSPYFLTGRNLGDLGLQVAPLALVALGQLAVVLLGGIDLSVGPLVSLVTAIVSWVATGDGAGPALLGALAGLGAGLGVGGLNALLVLRLRIPDLIATLASFSAVTGAALLVRPSPGGEIGEGFMDALTWQAGGVPAAIVVVVAAYLLAEWLLVRGRIGARLYAVGSSLEAAYAVGVPVGAVRAGAYLFSGVCAALAGLLVAARIGSGDPQAGAQFTLTSITAVVIGGASVSGGSGAALGALAGAVLVGLIQNALNLLHVSAYVQYVWAGLLTLLAVAASSARPGRRR